MISENESNMNRLRSKSQKRPVLELCSIFGAREAPGQGEVLLGHADEPQLRQGLITPNT
jgi:hypothetical protein